MNGSKSGGKSRVRFARERPAGKAAAGAERNGLREASHFPGINLCHGVARGRVESEWRRVAGCCGAEIFEKPVSESSEK